MTLAIPNLRKSRKRRLLAFVAFFVLLLGLERVPVWLMSVLLGYPFETHPLHMPYEQFTFLLNGGLVLLAVLAELRNARALLPRLFALLLGLLLFCLWSAIWLFFGERHSTFAFQLSMWHMLCGRLATPLLVLYVLDHVVTWWPTASPSERFWGKRLIVAVGVVIGIGALFTVLGGPDERYVLVLHRYGAWFLPGLVLWHTVMVRRGRLGDAVRAEPRADRPRPWTRGRILFGVGLSFAIALGPLALAEGWWTRPLPRITRFIEPLPTLRFREEDPPRTTGSDVGPFRPAPSGTVSGKLREPVFMQQAEGCGYEGCHTDIAKMWAVSAHRHSMNVFVERVMDRLVEERGIAAARYCAGCHDPVGLLAGKYRAGEVPVRGIENEGVTCLVCHATVHVADPARNGSCRLGRLRSSSSAPWTARATS